MLMCCLLVLCSYQVTSILLSDNLSQASRLVALPPPNDISLLFVPNTMRSAGPITAIRTILLHDTRLVDIIHGGFEGLSLPKGTCLDHLLRYTSYLRELHYIHKNYACRKILAKCDFIKWDSDFDDIFQRLKSEKKWSEFSDSSLKTALIEHFSLLHKLNDNLDISVGNTSEGDRILEAITKDYSEELSRLTKGIAEARMKNYVDHLEFKSLVNKCAAQAKALSTEFIAKDCALTPQKLFRLKDRAMTAESWMLEKFSRLKARVGGNYVGSFTRGVPAFLLLAASSVAALGTGRQKGLKIRKIRK